MNRRLVGVGVAAALGLALAFPGGTASAGGPPPGGPTVATGPVVFKNTSGVALRVVARAYVNASGQEVSLTAEWDVGPGFFGYLQADGNRITAQQFRYSVTTPEGTTHWYSDLGRPEGDGDFVVLFSEANYREHLAKLGPVGPDGQAGRR